MSARKTVEDVRREFLSALSGVRERGSGWQASCPVPGHGQGRGDKDPSLSVNEAEDRLLVNCLAGCPIERVVEAIGWTMADLFPRPNGRVVNLRVVRDKQETEGVTLEAYAEKTGLPITFLKELGLEQTKYRGKDFIKIPYRDPEGKEQGCCYRHALEKSPEGGDTRFKRKTGSKASLYGLEELERIKEDGYVVLCEGESDRQTLRYHDIRSLGIPGVDTWSDEWAEYLEDVKKVYAVIEPDDAGATLEKKLGESPLKDKLSLVSLAPYKDPNEMYKADPENFKPKFREAVRDAIHYQERERERAQEAAADYWEECSKLATKEDILAEFERDLKHSGVIGQKREAKICYLASVTRHFDTPTSVVVKGPSAGGKTFLVTKTLEFHPPEAHYALSAMSDKALAYLDEPLNHRHLCIYEATALEQSDMASYLIRTLLSEGHVRYVYADAGPEGTVSRVIEIEGPTGLFVTTTQQSLHPENETRMLSLTIADTQEQTKAVMLNIARRRKQRQGPDLSGWHALARWIAVVGEKRVEIPYSEWLAERIPPVAVRLRRDFEQVLNLVEAHAVLHQATRERNKHGEVVASIDDYTVVRKLLADLLAEQLESAVPPIVRETVEKLTELYNELETKGDGVSAGKLRKKLELDKNATARRLRMAIDKGYVRNLEDRKGKPGRYVPGDPLPDDVVVLPTSEDVPAELTRTTILSDSGDQRGTQNTLTDRTTVPSDPGDQEGTQNTFADSEKEGKEFRGPLKVGGARVTVVHASSEDKVFEDPSENGESLETVRYLTENEAYRSDGGHRSLTEENMATLIEEEKERQQAVAEGVRRLLNGHPEYLKRRPAQIACRLHMGRYTSFVPADEEIEAAMREVP